MLQQLFARFLGSQKRIHQFDGVDKGKERIGKREGGSRMIRPAEGIVKRNQ